MNGDHFTVDTSLRDVVKDMQRSRIASSTASNYRTAIRALEKHLQTARVAIGDVTPDVLSVWGESLSAAGCTERERDRKVRAVEAVVRHADPDRLPTLSPESNALVTKMKGRLGRRQWRRVFADSGVAGSLDHLLTEEFFPVRMNITTEHSERQYGLAVSKMATMLGRTPMVSDLNDKTVGQLARWMRDEGLSVFTINGYLKRIKSLWNWAAKRRIVEHFPTIENLPYPAQIPKCWTIEELRRLIAATELMGGAVCDVPAWLWWKGLHYVAWDTGERRGALLSLRWEWLDVETGSLAVPAEVRKGGRKPMLYQLKAPTVALLVRMRQPERELIFPWDRDTHVFYRHYKKLLRYARLPYERNRSGLHKIRRSFASHIEAAGGNATIALNHSDRETTLAYLDPRVSRATPANALLFDLESAITEGGR